MSKEPGEQEILISEGGEGDAATVESSQPQSKGPSSMVLHGGEESGAGGGHSNLALFGQLLSREGTDQNKVMDFALELAKLQAQGGRAADKAETARLKLQLQAQTEQAKIKAGVEKARIKAEAAQKAHQVAKSIRESVRQARLNLRQELQSLLKPFIGSAGQLSGQTQQPEMSRATEVSAPMNRRKWLGLAAGGLAAAGLVAAGVKGVLDWQEGLAAEDEKMFASQAERMRLSTEVAEAVFKENKKGVRLSLDPRRAEREALGRQDILPFVDPGERGELIGNNLWKNIRRDGEFVFRLSFSEDNDGGGTTTYLAELPPIERGDIKFLRGSKMRLTKEVDNKSKVSRARCTVPVGAAGIIESQIADGARFHEQYNLAGEVLEKFAAKLAGMKKA